MENIDKSNKILIIELLEKIEDIQKDFKELKIEIEKNITFNEFININSNLKNKKSGWFF